MGRAPSRLGNPGWTRRRRRSKPRIAPGAYLRDQTRRGTSEASFTSKPTFATLALPRRVAWSTNMVQDREVNSSTAGKTIDRSIRWDTISVWLGILVPQPFEYHRILKHLPSPQNEDPISNDCSDLKSLKKTVRVLIPAFAAAQSSSYDLALMAGASRFRGATARCLA